MLPKAIVLEIERLLREDVTQRAIAQRLGVSRGTVGNIANGRRGLHGREPEPSAGADDQRLGIPIRCRSCGGLVCEPCVLCRARAYRLRRKELRRLFAGRPRPTDGPRRVA